MYSADPDATQIETLFAQALALHGKGLLHEAEALYRSILATQHDHCNSLNNLGILLKNEHRLPEALDCFLRLAELEIPSPRAQSGAGAVLRELGRIGEAESAYRDALKQDGTFTPALHNLGNLLYETGRFKDAVDCFRECLRRQPDDMAARFMFGKSLLETGQLHDAQAELECLLERDPEHVEARGTLARVWLERHCPAEALLHLDQAVAMRPDYAGLRYNRALARLLAGDIVGGFSDYEHRFEVPAFPGQRVAPEKPRWTGDIRHDQTLLLYAEQGLGDTLQFLRFLDQAAARVQKVFLLIPRVLASLVILPANVELLHDGEPWPQFDLTCPLLSLPHVLKIGLLDLPRRPPYLAVPAPDAARWAKRINGPGLRIGLVWAGNPAHKNDANRSLPFPELEPLWGLSNVSWYALQIHADKSFEVHTPEILTNLAPDLDEFGDTASALQQLDLLICVDTSIAHLAGGLGLPAWVLLPHMPDWRWQLHRNDSPWYPSLRLFRQRLPGDWRGVIEELRTELRKLAAPPPNSNQESDRLFEAGRQWLEQGEIHRAEPFFWEVLRKHPQQGLAANALAVCAFRRRDYKRAIQFGVRACRQDPANPETWSNCGAYWKAGGQLNQALATFEAGLREHPSYPGLIYNRGLARLLNGDLAHGFADYERRFDVPDFPSRRLQSNKPLWQGQHVEHLLVHAEQGLGDSLQFMRYLPTAAKRVGTLYILIQPTLARLIQLPANAKLVRDGACLPDFDAISPLLSLPHLLGLAEDPKTEEIPYLYADPQLAHSWRSRALPEGLRIGLVWAGNPGHKNDGNRSLAFNLLHPLLELKGISWFSLQVGSRSQDLQQGKHSVIDLAPELDDFADTAAALQQLDLLICVDTSIAHLAGALGIPVWLLLPWIPDWRWQMDRPDSPWYPSMRLFRQPSAGNWVEVIARIRAELIAQLEPDSAAGLSLAHAVGQHIAAGSTALALGKPAEAELHFWAALCRQPACGMAANALAVSYWQQGRTDPAVLLGCRASRLLPESAEAWSNGGAYLKAAKQYEVALHYQEHALRLTPESPVVRANMANLLGALNRWNEALSVSGDLFREHPENPENQFSYALALKETGQFPEALAHFRELQSLPGTHPRACLHEAMLELLTGDLLAGWHHYESRWEQPDCKEKRELNAGQWRGQSLAGKTILLHAEQGFGDTLQFLRYAPLVADQAQHVILVVQPELESLARRLDPRITLIKSGQALPPYDLHCPLLSLPLAFGSTLENIPATIPYLHPLPALRELWHQRLPREKAYRIGLVWAGRPTHGNDNNRSLALTQLATLINSVDAEWIALQKGPALAQIQDTVLAKRITVPGDAMASFEDTAAILSELDELVSVDTSVAHLAGALGRPVRLLLPWIPDWRWLLERTDSPWYPSMRLYRQKVRGEWQPVLESLACDLAKTIANRRVSNGQYAALQPDTTAQ